MPYSSNTGTPMPMKNSSTSGAIGAAPDPGVAAAAQADAGLQGAEGEREGDGVADAAAERVVAAVGDAGPADRAGQAEAEAEHRTLEPRGVVAADEHAGVELLPDPGTAKNSVGWISLRFVVIVSIDSAKLSTAPHRTRCHVEKTRSATWHSGR